MCIHTLNRYAPPRVEHIGPVARPSELTTTFERLCDIQNPFCRGMLVDYRRTGSSSEDQTGSRLEGPGWWIVKCWGRTSAGIRSTNLSFG